MKGISQALKSADEVKAVAAELQRNARSNLFYCLWVFMYESGLRISDVLKLKYEDVEGQSHLKVRLPLYIFILELEHVRDTQARV